MRSNWKRFIPAIVILLVIGLAYAMGWQRYVSFEALARYQGQLLAYREDHYVALLLGFSLTYVIVVAASLPAGTVFTLAAGYLFGTWIGGGVVLVSATLGATLIFLIAKLVFKDAVVRRLGPRAEKLRAGFERNAFNYLLTLRLIPVVPFWLLNLAPAALNVDWRPYVAATAIGMAPAVFVYTSLGNGLGAAIEAGEAGSLTGAIFRPEILLPLLGLAALALMPVIYKRLRGRPLTESSDQA